jgi:hypothetical protein
MSLTLRYMEVCQHVGPDTTTQSISVVSKYEFKKTQMQDLDFTAVNTPNVKVTLDGSARKSPKSRSVFTLTLCNQQSMKH